MVLSHLCHAEPRVDPPEKGHFISTITTFSSVSVIPANSWTLGTVTSANYGPPNTSEKVPEKASLNELQCFLKSFHTYL